MRPRPRKDQPTEDPSGLSLLSGSPLPDPGLKNLAQALRRAAARNPHPALCLIADDGSEHWSTYTQLLRAAERTRAGLHRAGANAGDRVLLHLTAEHDLLVAFWACILGGLIPTPLGAQLDARTVEKTWYALDQPWIVTDREAGARLPGPIEGPRASWLGSIPDLDQDPHESEPTTGDWNDVAMLVLTAGSTGAPKTVMLSHGNILSRSAATAQANELTPRSTTFNWMPLDHVSGLVMFHVRDVLLGATQLHARKTWVLADPLRWLDVVHRHRVDTTWAANAAFDLVSDHVEAAPERSWDLSCLRYIMNGGAPIKPRTARRFLVTLAPHGLPETAMRPGWGMSETASGIVDHRLDPGQLSDDDRYVPVGIPHPGVSIRIVDGDDHPLPRGRLGHLQVSGSPITYGYFNNAALNRQAFTLDGWFRTGDMAFVKDGALTVTGSADDLIALEDRSCHGHEIETAVGALPFVEPSSAVACLVHTGELAVFYALTGSMPPAHASAHIKQVVHERFGLPVTYVVPMSSTDIPRTATGKPKRAVLRASFCPPTKHSAA